LRLERCLKILLICQKIRADDQCSKLVIVKGRGDLLFRSIAELPFDGYSDALGPWIGRALAIWMPQGGFYIGECMVESGNI